jgi:uncharacterized protein RhaS with RHS repeats
LLKIENEVNILWLNRDPLGERGGLNLYDYVRNSPINRMDPLGLFGADPYTLPPVNGSQINGVPALTINGPGNGSGPITISNNDSPEELAMLMTAGGAVGLAALATLGLAGPDEVVAGGGAACMSSDAVLAAIDAIEAAEAAASQAELNYLVTEGNLIIATETGSGELIAIAAQNSVDAEWAVINTGNQLEFALMAFRALIQ